MNWESKYSLSHTDSENRNLAGEMLDSISAYSGVGAWVTRARADDQLCWILSNEFLHSDLVIAVNCNCCALKHKVLVNVPGEGVVVIDHNKVGSIFERRHGGMALGGMVDELKRRHDDLKINARRVSLSGRRSETGL